jgi:predicted enzyme related to lactoylglutathione lyase
MLAESKLVYLFVYVRDLALSREFYEHKLGLRVIEEDAGCVKFDCGHVILALNRAADYNVTLPNSRDRSTEAVFLVEDALAMCSSLRSRGVDIKDPAESEPGRIANFFDPDGHWFSLYQPSQEALTWPSGDHLRAVINSQQHSNGNSHKAPPTGAAAQAGEGLRLDGSGIIYLFLFVRDAEEAEAFYHDDLGLRDIEGGPCSQTTAGDEPGVTKYDTGGVIVSTHYIKLTPAAAEAMRRENPPRALFDEHLKSVVPVFFVKDAKHAAQTISRRRAGFNPKVTRSGIGVVASFDDPSGHRLCLYEPSEEALQLPSGQKIREILSAQI